MHDGVDNAISVMWEKFDQPLSLTDIAGSAILSPFYFSRLFRRRTGVSPLRFLAAVRLYQAKQLLLTTSLTVADISCRVGYSSVGTFTTRFSESVGLSPTQFRRRAQIRPVKDAPTVPTQSGQHGRVVGRVTPGVDAVPGGRIYVGVFPSRIPQGQPESWAELDEPGPFRLDHVRPGHWYVMAATVLGGPRPPGDGEARVLVACVGPVAVTGTGEPTYVDLLMRPQVRTDPPVLLALPGLHGQWLRDEPEDELEARLASSGS